MEIQQKQVIRERIIESIETKKIILQEDAIISTIDDVVEEIKLTIQNGGKILLCGNGGSASDAAHIAGEFVGRFQKERCAIPAIAISNDYVSTTAIANDYGYDRVFARAIEGYINQGDILIGLSTSGDSENVFLALQRAKELGGKTIGLLGKSGGKIKEIVDYSIVVPNQNTARIQESHIMIGHIICELVEASIT